MTRTEHGTVVSAKHTQLTTQLCLRKKVKICKFSDNHLEHVYTYEKDGSVCSPGGTSAAHPDSDSETVIGDNDGDNVQKSSTSGGAPATRMYGGFGPEPEGGNPDGVFIDDGQDDDDGIFIDNGVPDDDEVGPIALTAGLGPPPDDPDDAFVDDDDDDDAVDSTTVAPAPVVTSPLAYGAPVATSPYDDDGSWEQFMECTSGHPAPVNVRKLLRT